MQKRDRFGSANDFYLLIKKGKSFAESGDITIENECEIIP
jgi:hypothetical protein